MGKVEEWSEPNGLLLNGLLPSSESVISALDPDRWLKAEERIEELIVCIQPNQPSEERRNAVADYVQRLIMKCFPCQVFTFGSVPLKTYLPDGDIDVTAFSNNQTLKDTWANQVRDMLENEEKNEEAEFCVKEVQYIQAEVKIIKCLVGNIVVDISFNQLGGLCTLCFLEEVDHLISQNHLFKRSIILIKAWCYYESRILGAPHGLISTYALETLVLYIFHVFNNSFIGPLEVLYRFLEFFGNFDWDNFCVSLWGPVPISSLPDVTVEPPRKDCADLLLSKTFLDACSSVYAVFLSGQENQGQPFVSKHFNVIDPLRMNNNLGRSVSKGNFYRIRSAFTFGAKKLSRLLDCPKENVYYEVNKFFTNTWERHGSGQRPDAPRTETPQRDSSKLSESDHLKKNRFRKSGNMSWKNDIPTRVNVNNAGQRNMKSGHLVNGKNGRFTFASPELAAAADTYIDFQGQDGNKRKNEELSSTMMGDQEEQDLVNMMGSTSLHHHQFNSQVPHFPLPPSFLASLGYTTPSNVDPSHFPHGFIPQPLAHRFPRLNPPPNLEYSSSEKKMEVNLAQNENGQEHLDDYRFQDKNGTEAYNEEERMTSSRISSASRSTTPESSSDGSSSKISKSIRVSKELTNNNNSYGKGKTMSEQSNVGTEIVERNLGAPPVTPPMLVGSKENPGLVAFYPTGPPVPFLTMLPVYDETESSSITPSDTSSHNFDSTSDDILSSDFASHFQNLQYGRFCQNPPNPGPMFYQSPVMIPPGYLQGRIPWDNTSHLMGGYGSRVLPVSPRPPNVYQPFASDIPKHRSGTGTYFPNPKISVRDRQPPSNARRGNYNNYDNYGDRDGNWNMYYKPRGRGGYNRSSQTDKSNSRLDRFSSNDSRGGGPSSVGYGGVYNGGVSSSSHGQHHDVLMVYPFEHDNTSSGSHGEQLEFGSLGPVGGVNDSLSPHTSNGSQASGAQFDEHHRFHETSGQQQPSSPHHRRRK